MNTQVVTFGEVMMRLSAAGHSRLTQADHFNVLFAGAEANVAVSLANFGVSAAHVTRFPDHDFGKAATQTLNRYGVNTQHIIYGPERLGLYFLENGAMHRSSKIIYDRADSAFAHIKPGMVDWQLAMKGVKWFHWSGITPAISEGAAAVCHEAIVAARKAGAVVSGDINYRRNLWQYGKRAIDVMPDLIGLSDRIVGAAVDFENCLGITSLSFGEAAQKVMKAYPSVKKIAMTQRESINANHNKIAGLLWNGKEMHQSREYDLTHIVDRVGAGDAFMAGLIFCWLNNEADSQVVEFATAACALKHAIEGDVNLSTTEEVKALLKGENIGKLLR